MCHQSHLHSGIRKRWKHGTLVGQTAAARIGCSLSGHQGPSGRHFQLRDGSGSSIAKNFGFGFGYGSGTGIYTIYLINRVLSGNKKIDRVFFGYINMAFSFCMDAVQVQNFPKENSH